MCTAGKEVKMADYMKSVHNSPERKFLTASDVAEILNVSRSTAYRIIRRLNDELNKAGKITVAGKSPPNTSMRIHTCDFRNGISSRLLFQRKEVNDIADLQRRKDRALVLQVCI